MTTSKGTVKFSVDQHTWQAAFHKVLQPNSEARLRNIFAHGEEDLTTLANGWGFPRVRGASELLALRYQSGLDNNILLDGVPAELPAFHFTGDCTYVRLKTQFIRGLLREYQLSLWTSNSDVTVAEPVIMRGPALPGPGFIPVFHMVGSPEGIVLGPDVPGF